MYPPAFRSKVRKAPLDDAGDAEWLPNGVVRSLLGGVPGGSGGHEAASAPKEPTGDASQTLRAVQFAEHVLLKPCKS